MTQKVDPRIQRTQILIRDAFIALIIDKGFDNVTIQAIVQKAGINRTTFYRHYTDKYDLAHRLTDTLFADVRNQLKPQPDGFPIRSWQILFQHVAEYEAFYRAMLSRGGIPNFNERIRETIEEQLTSWLPAFGFNKADAKMPIQLSIRYLAAAQVGFIQWWLENDMPLSPTQAAMYLRQLHEHGALWALGLLPHKSED